MAKIVFIVQMPFSQRDYDRFGIGWMVSQGMSVTVLDMADIIHPEPPRRDGITCWDGIALRIVSDGAALRACLPLLKAADLGVLFAGSGYVTPRLYPMLRLLSRSGLPYLISSTNAIPEWMQPVKTTMVESWLSRIRRMKPLDSLANRLPPRLLGLRMADFVVYGGEASQIWRPLVGPKTQAIWAHASDYDLYLQRASASSVQTSKPTAVFLDQNFGFHPGATVEKRPQAVDPAYFYPRLRRLFDRIETELGLEVVIAVHPRARYDDADALFGNRQIVSGRTAELIQTCALAITSFSTAAGLAVMFGKPLLIYSADSIKTHPNYTIIVDSLAACVGKPIQYVDAPDAIDLRDALTVRHDLYADYVRQFIRRDGLAGDGRMFWPLVLDACLEKVRPR